MVFFFQFLILMIYAKNKLQCEQREWYAFVKEVKQYEDIIKFDVFFLASYKINFDILAELTFFILSYSLL